MARKKANTKQVMVAGKVYTIRRESLEGAYGYCESGRQTILIADNLEEVSNLSPEIVELHEILHAILFETGLSALVEDRVEEAIVTGLAIQLANTGYRRV